MFLFTSTYAAQPLKFLILVKPNLRSTTARTSKNLPVMLETINQQRSFQAS